MENKPWKNLIYIRLYSTKGWLMKKYVGFVVLFAIAAISIYSLQTDTVPLYFSLPTLFVVGVLIGRLL